MILFDQTVELGGNVFLVEGTLGQIEVEPAATVPNRTSGHAGGNDHAQQMQQCVHAHEPMATLPVDAGFHLLSGEICAYVALGNVNDVSRRAVLASVADADLTAILKT